MSMLGSHKEARPLTLEEVIRRRNEETLAHHFAELSIADQGHPQHRQQGR